MSEDDYVKWQDFVVGVDFGTAGAEATVTFQQLSGGGFAQVAGAATRATAAMQGLGEAIGEAPPDKLKIRSPNGRWITIEPLLFGRVAVKITNPQPDDIAEDGRSLSEEDFDRGFCDEEYTYPSMEAAWAAVLDWDGKGDPPDGWIRHKPSNRRRPSGDPAREEVRE